MKREGVVGNGRVGDTADGEIGECGFSGRAEGEGVEVEVEAEAEDEVGSGRWWWTEIVRGVGEVGEGDALAEVDEEVCGEGEGRGQR